ncbi:MAG: dicarboxylate transport protein [Paucimonas sp.]|nr:dicarboxylate transport protein [Paucimonas sp.]
MKKTFPFMPTVLAASLLACAGAASAQETITLKVAHFLPPASTAHAKLIEPWCAKINKESNNRLKCQIYPSMQLGGSPPQLFDQLKDGVADIAWTLPGYQSGRFVVSEAFELPFMVKTTEAGSRALWTYATKNATKEFEGVKPILFHLHDGNTLHTTKKPIKTLEDFRGLKLRAPTRQSTKMIAAFGATPVPMPLPQAPEALSKGVIDGAMVPWEVAPSIKLEEIVGHHIETDTSMPQVSNSVFIFGMNLARYNSLPADLKKVIDNNSGADASAAAGKIFADAGVAGRKVSEKFKGSFYTVPASELQRWQKASEGVVNDWVKDVSAKGYDGQKLLQEARALLK